MRRGLKVVAQRKSWDCGISALESLLGESYGDVSAAVRELFPDDQAQIKRLGLNLKEVEAVAAHFGTTLVRHYRRKNNGHLVGRTGILGVTSPKMHSAGHWVVLKDGTHIIEVDGAEVWKLEDYLRHWNARACTLLAVR